MKSFSRGQPWSSVILTCVILLLIICGHSGRSLNEEDQHHHEDGEVYTNSFAVEVPGGPLVARNIAENLGYTYLGQVIPDENIFHFVHNSIVKRSISPSFGHHRSLEQEHRVNWFQQQKGKKRVKRSVAEFNDPRWSQMWYLNRGHEQDMNVGEAWATGFTGKNIVITILDDGLERKHPDLIANYDPLASFDVNHNDSDPQPRYDLSDSNRHGTRCAGEIAAKPNNKICTVGVAYESRVGGVRMLDGDVTDVVEARSLSINPQHIDIYSASWGPDDDGRTVDGPGKLATKAFINGIIKGRGGLGSIFVWASGNGGREEDNCNCDGYTNSIWTLSISSVTENGLVPWYSEACSSSLATTYSSGSAGERQIITTDLHYGCTNRHTGTSASAPLAAGIIALALQANRNLTWRDMQHIVVRTARPAKLFAKDWAVNGVGRKVSHSFGYGLMDASAMVRLARTWKTAPKAKECEIRAHHMNKVIPAKSHVELSLEINTCKHVNFLEHVQAKITLKSSRRGELRIYLISPSGTRSTLLALRPHDNSKQGFNQWPFMTVHNWGEHPRGKWVLEIHNEGRYFGRAVLLEWSLILYGTTQSPDNHQAPMPAPTSTTTMSTTTETTTPSISTTVFQQTKVIKPSTYTKPKTLKPVADNTINHGHIQKPYDGKVAVMDWSHLQHEGQAKAVGNVSSESCILSSNGRCLGCLKPYKLFTGLCVWNCPSGHFAMATSGKHGVISGEACQMCHYTCKHCTGPQDNHCSGCFDDAKLLKSQCYPLLLSLKLEKAERWEVFTIVALIILFILLISLIVYIFCEKMASHPSRLYSSPCAYSKLDYRDHVTNGVYKDDSDGDF